MPGTTFTQFSQLPRELRDMIWSFAATDQFQYQTEKKPAFTKRLREAFLGNRNLAHDAERQPPKIFVHDSRDKMRVGTNELQTMSNREFRTLVNCLPMAAVSFEARSYAINICRTKVQFVNLIYIINEPGEPEELSVDGNDIPDNGLAQPTTVMVTTKLRMEGGSSRFESAEHLIRVLHRVFDGNFIQHIILESWFETSNTFERIYWPHAAQTWQHRDIEPVLIDRLRLNHDNPNFFMKERVLHAKKKWNHIYLDKSRDLEQLFWHLLKLQEVFDAAAQKLPQLRSIELVLHIHCWDDILLTKFKAIKRNDGTLYIDKNDFAIGYHHFFDRQGDSDW